MSSDRFTQLDEECALRVDIDYVCSLLYPDWEDPASATTIRASDGRGIIAIVPREFHPQLIEQMALHLPEYTVEEYAADSSNGEYALLFTPRMKGADEGTPLFGVSRLRAIVADMLIMFAAWVVVVTEIAAVRLNPNLASGKGSNES